MQGGNQYRMTRNRRPMKLKENMQFGGTNETKWGQSFAVDGTSKESRPLQENILW